MFPVGISYSLQLPVEREDGLWKIWGFTLWVESDFYFGGGIWELTGNFKTKWDQTCKTQ